jgi:hypothetical protein
MANKAKISSPMNNPFPTPSPNPGGGTFGHHTTPSITKPADKGVLDLKFYAEYEGTPATTSSPMNAPKGIGYKK